mgnify:CR=1 FL=1
MSNDMMGIKTPFDKDSFDIIEEREKGLYCVVTQSYLRIGIGDSPFCLYDTKGCLCPANKSFCFNKYNSIKESILKRANKKLFTYLKKEHKKK